MSQLVSFVIPCYRSAKTIGGVIAEIDDIMGTMKEYSHEIILVNDCSPDDTFEVIRDICAGRKDITGVNLARNFGQHAALMAGFRQTRGDVVVCLDDDGQTPADEVGRLLAQIEQGSDVVYAKYTHKQHSGFRNFGSKINELMTRVMLGKPKELYAMTIHKMQGSECRLVVMPVFNNRLSKHGIYTAVTRAKRSVVLIGNEEDLRKGLQVEIQERESNLRKRLQAQILHTVLPSPAPSVSKELAGGDEQQSLFLPAPAPSAASPLCPNRDITLESSLA